MKIARDQSPDLASSLANCAVQIIFIMATKLKSKNLLHFHLVTKKPVSYKAFQLIYYALMFQLSVKHSIIICSDSFD